MIQSFQQIATGRQAPPPPGVPERLTGPLRTRAVFLTKTLLTHSGIKRMDRVQRIRIDDNLIQQIDHYDLSARIGWSRRAKVDYLLRIGLAVLLETVAPESNWPNSPTSPSPVIVRRQIV